MIKLLGTILLFAGLAFSAATRYISPTGSDTSNTCVSNVTPCKTFQRAENQSTSGDTVLVHAGVYPQTVVWIPSKQNITYQVYGDGDVWYTGAPAQSGLTWTQDISGTYCPTCTSVWYVNLPTASYKYFTQLWYSQCDSNGLNCGDILRRRRPWVSTRNAIPATNSAPFCVSGVATGHTSGQMAANFQCGCPDAGSGGQCANLASPCASSTPWSCAFIKWKYTTGDVSCTWKEAGLGHIDVLPFAEWTVSRLAFSTTDPLGNAGCQSNIAWVKAPDYASDGFSGFEPGYDTYIENVAEKAVPGQWWLSLNDGGAGNFRLYFFGGVGENPTHGKVYFSQIANSPATSSSLIRATSISGLHFIGNISGGSNFYFMGDGWYPGPNGLPDQGLQPQVPGAISLVNSCNWLFDNVTVIHTNGGGIDVQGTPCTSGTKNVIQNSNLVDTGSFGMRFGHVWAHADTNSNVPGFALVQNNLFWDDATIDPTGEDSYLMIGDANNIDVEHNDCFGTTTGCVEFGQGLNLGTAGDGLDTAAYMYNLHFAYNHVKGRCSGGQCESLMKDFGGTHSATNLSSMCPMTEGDPGTNPANYCNEFDHNLIEDQIGDYTDTSHNLGVCLYFDTGAAYIYVHDNICVRSDYRGMFLNASGGGHCLGVNCDPNSAFLPPWMWFDNNFFIGIGSTQVFQRAGSNLIPSLLARGGTPGQGTPLHMWRFSHNVALINSDPSGPGTHLNAIAAGWVANDDSPVTITSHGTACPNHPSVNISAGSCTTAPSLYATALAGSLVAVSIQTAGAGCTTNLAFTVASCTGATLSPTLADDGTGHGTVQVVKSTPTPLADITDGFNNYNNVYWDVAGNQMFYSLCKTDPCKSNRSQYNSTNYNFFNVPPFPWNTGQGSNQDKNSLVLNPGFSNPTWPTNDYHLTADLTTLGIHAIDYSTFGRTTILSSFPEQTWMFFDRFTSQVTDFLPLVVPTPFTTLNGRHSLGGFTTFIGTHVK